MAHELAPLPYDYNALEPHIDEMTMRIHHGKHHQAYVTNLNTALEKFTGTLVFISHDVHFIRKLANKVLHVNSGKVTPYAGGYDYFLEKSGALLDERAALTAG